MAGLFDAEEKLIAAGMQKILGWMGKKGAGYVVKSIANDITKKPALETAEIIPSVSRNLTHSRTGFTFGAQNGQIVAKDENADGHILVVGGAGSGKSTCIAIPSLLSWGKRVFVIDIKGELYNATCHKRPYIRLFNPLGNDTLGYDPFYALRRTNNQVQEAQAIANALVPLPPDTPDPFSSLLINFRAILRGQRKRYSMVRRFCR